MSAVISLIKTPSSVANVKSSQTFSAQGGTIGRGDENSWVLEDPERYISTKHSQIVCEGNDFYLIDLSTNGTYLNRSPEPIGKGNRVKLQNGDRFSLGDYVFEVSLNGFGASVGGSPETNDPFAAFDNHAPATPFGSPFEPQGSPVIGSDPFSSPAIDQFSNQDSFFGVDNQELDPLAAFDKARPSIQSDYKNPFLNNPSPGFSYSDQADVMNESVAWPHAAPDAGLIPENWDDDMPANQSAQRHSPTPVKVAPVQEASQEFRVPSPSRPRPQAKKTRQEETGSANHNRAEHAPNGATSDLIEAMGLSVYNLSPEKVAEITDVVGQLVRETIQGMMQVLSSRSNIKNEFRMNVTTIQPVENNPLKFSATLDDALENMFIKEGNSYKKPIDAVQEGFQSIGEHQLAILAGIRSAFRGMLERFDPIKLEKRFEKFNKGGLIPGSQKARNWELYSTHYKDLTDNLDATFQNIFGYDFVRAYEEQLQKIAFSKKQK